LSDALERGRAARAQYFFGEQLTALDIYWAAGMNILAPLPEEQCPMLPMMRAAFESMRSEIASAISPELLRHRERIYERHLELPIAL
jgi:hypothetical protein